MKVTISKFQELYKISLMDINEAEKSALLVQEFTGMSEEQVNKMPLKKFNKLCAKINKNFEQYGKELDDKKPQKYVWVKNRLYLLEYDLAKPPMNAGRYVELATYSDDIIGNLHKIMATMCTPLKFTFKGLKRKEKIHSKVADDMLDIDFEVAYHSAVFFYAVFSKSIQASATYFKTIATDTAKVEEVMKNLAEFTDGFITAKWYRNLKELV
jgi:hypothetical protein